MTEKVEDFTNEPVSAPPSAGAGTMSPSDITKVYDPAPERESIRGKIALQLLWLISAILLAITLLLIFRVIAGVDDVLKLVGAFLTPIVGLFGAVMGFYFGEKSVAAPNGRPQGAPAPALPPAPNKVPTSPP